MFMASGGGQLGYVLQLDNLGLGPTAGTELQWLHGVGANVDHPRFRSTAVSSRCRAIVGMNVVLRLLLVGALTAGAAAACGSGNDRQVPRDGAAGGAGEASGGVPSSGGSASTSAGESGTGTKVPTGGAEGTAGEGALAGSENGAGSPAEGGTAGSGLPGSGGEAGMAPDFGDPTSVAEFGCFIRSGDGGDLLADGSIAVNVTNPVYSAACDSAWVSRDENAFAPQATPTTLVMRRAFVIDEDLGAGRLSITYKADDAIDFVLNGELIIGCTPPSDNAGFCQQVCSTSTIPAAALRPAGEVNLLEARLVNLQSLDAGNGNYGYTALNYSVCVSPDL
jgi:hypothetical protein